MACFCYSAHALCLPQYWCPSNAYSQKLMACTQIAHQTLMWNDTLLLLSLASNNIVICQVTFESMSGWHSLHITEDDILLLIVCSYMWNQSMPGYILCIFLWQFEVGTIQIQIWQIWPSRYGEYDPLDIWHLASGKFCYPCVPSCNCKSEGQSHSSDNNSCELKSSIDWSLCFCFRPSPWLSYSQI